MSSSLPLIAISTGDPAGVGPELSLRVIQETSHLCHSVLFADARVMVEVAGKLDLAVPQTIPLAQWLAAENTDPNDKGLTREGPLLVDVQNIEGVQPGKVSADTGRASYDYVMEAIRACSAQRVAGMVTGPIHKDALNAAGIKYPGHTEILAEETDAERICMMLTSEQITCSVVTAHIGLDEVASQLSEESVFNAIELSHEALSRMRGRPARLVVCGLNPHAGEGGLFGNQEEQRILEPAIRRAIAQGIEVQGPLPADTAFIPKIRSQTDGYICMYHDQGLIPLKALAFDTAVNVTLGLPIVRTSVDHGTALDLAWQGKAEVTSFIKAVELAVKLSRA